jgi:hypothetical protein
MQLQLDVELASLTLEIGEMASYLMLSEAKYKQSKWRVIEHSTGCRRRSHRTLLSVRRIPTTLNRQGREASYLRVLTT